MSLNLPKRFQDRYNYLFDKKEYINILKRQLERHPPCNHPGCYSHISKLCDGCSRTQGELPEEEKIRIKELIRDIEFPKK